MRRAQIDSGSQPIRNQWTNPTFDASSGNGAVRTNHATNPSMETAGAGVSVRTNLCPNPSFEVGTTGWGSNHGNLVGSHDTTTGYVGTSSYKGTWTQDGSTGGLNNVASNMFVTPGETIIGSFYVKATKTINVAAQLRFRDAGGVTTGDFTGTSVSVGTSWTRVSFSYTVPANSVRVFIQASWQTLSVTGDAYWIDAVLVERGVALLPYFDGSTAAANNLTYAWTGTANNSASEQQGLSVNTRTGLPPNGVSWQSTERARTGTKSAQVLIKNALPTNATMWYPSGDYIVGSGLPANTMLTWSVWVYIPSGSTAKVMLCDVTAGGTYGTPSADVYDQWQQISHTFTTAASGICQLRLRTSGTGNVAGTTFWIDDELIEQGNVAMPYFDGSTPASGDFTYLWTGTANASTSQQRGVGLPGVTAGNSQVIQSSEWAANGTKSLRIVPNNQFNTSSAIMLSGAQLERGKTYTAIATRRLTAPLTGTLSAYAGSIIFVHTSVGTYYSNFIVNSAGVGVAKLKFFLADNGTTWTLRLGHGGSQGSGDVWWDNFMVVEGDYEGDFINPAQNVLAKWDGAADASTSVGYSPQMLDIAGKPILDYSTAGTHLLDNSFGPQEGRSFYTIVEVLGENTGAVSPILQYGDNNLSDTVPNTYIQLRQDNDFSTNGANFVFLRRSGAAGVSTTAKTFSRHVLAWGCNASGQLFLGADGNTRITDTAQTMTLLHQRLLISADQPLNKHIRTIAFRGVHDSTTALAMSRYLGNKYGAAVA